jgi:hypothetical protein
MLMTTIISAAELAELYKCINALALTLADITGEEYVRGRLAREINSLRICVGRWTKIQEDLLRTKNGITFLDDSYYALFNECDQHGLYVSEECPMCPVVEASERRKWMKTDQEMDAAIENLNTPDAAINQELGIEMSGEHHNVTHPTMESIMIGNGHPDEGPCVVCGHVFDAHAEGCVFDKIEALAEPELVSVADILRSYLDDEVGGFDSIGLDDAVETILRITRPAPTGDSGLREALEKAALGLRHAWEMLDAICQNDPNTDRPEEGKRE